MSALMRKKPKTTTTPPPPSSSSVPPNLSLKIHPRVVSHSGASQGASTLVAAPAVLHETPVVRPISGAPFPLFLPSGGPTPPPTAPLVEADPIGNTTAFSASLTGLLSERHAADDNDEMPKGEVRPIDLTTPHETLVLIEDTPEDQQCLTERRRDALFDLNQKISSAERVVERAEETLVEIYIQLAKLGKLLQEAKREIWGLKEWQQHFKDSRL